MTIYLIFFADSSFSLFVNLTRISNISKAVLLIDSNNNFKKSIFLKLKKYTMAKYILQNKENISNFMLELNKMKSLCVCLLW